MHYFFKNLTHNFPEVFVFVVAIVMTESVSTISLLFTFRYLKQSILLDVHGCTTSLGVVINCRLLIKLYDPSRMRFGKEPSWNQHDWLAEWSTTICRCTWSTNLSAVAVQCFVKRWKVSGKKDSLYWNQSSWQIRDAIDETYFLPVMEKNR